MIVKIRESLDLDTLFKTTAQEVRKSLRADRVGVFSFDPDSNYCYGEFVSEAVLPGYDSAIAIKVRDYCFGEQYAAQYHQGRMQVVVNAQRNWILSFCAKIYQKHSNRCCLVLSVFRTLSISYQIITEKHGGKLACFSTLGKGTEFVIHIPIRLHVREAVYLLGKPT